LRRTIALLASLSIVVFVLGALSGASAASYPHVKLRNQTWHCHSLQRHTQVNVTIVDKRLDGIHLDAGCTGVIRVNVNTNTEDGIKVHDGVHDLVIWGKITCHGRMTGAHQDGTQAMGGSNVTLKWVKVDCPTGNNGGLFVNEGRGGHQTPTDILCSYCTLHEGNAALNVGADSIRSGARNSSRYPSSSSSSRAPPTSASTPAASGQGRHSADA
jgi:hypothetical protein